MKSKTSLFKKGIIISDLKRYWWISAIFSLGLILAIPVAHYMQKSNLDDVNYPVEIIKQSIERELNFRSGISPLFPLLVPVLIAVLTYSYIQKGHSASLYHSLPLTRTALYLNSLASSLLLYAIPLMINVLVMIFLNWFSFLSAFYTAALILKWLGLSLLFGVMFMSMTIFVGMFTGSSIAQIIFVYILNLLPAFLFETLRANLSELLYGFSTYSDTSIYDRLPMIMRFSNRPELTPLMIAGYIVLTVVLIAAGLVAFKLRRPETAGDIITFKPVKPVFIYGVTVCATLVGGAYFHMIGKYNLSSTIFGYFIGSLLGYIVVQMITLKSFKVFRTYKGYLAYALIIIAVLLGIRFDVFGYVNKVPSPDQVAEVYMGNDIFWWRNKDNKNMQFLNPYSENIVFTDTANIKSLTRLHKMILEDRSKNGYLDYIAYKLKNGKKIVRYYTIDTNLYASVLGPIYESEGYKEDRFPILHQKAADLKLIEIHDYTSNEKAVVISDKSQLDSFIKEMQKDINGFKYQQLVPGAETKRWIDVTYEKDKRISYEINTNYTNTLDWINKLG